ncbi:MAG: MazG family protein [Lachnospiraceae bacterium]|nr:MazG family protein [Lachnospiraceae bacterium]
MEHKYTFEEFCGIIERLRGKDGCPWDRIQTHESLIPCMVEEAYEVVEGVHILSETGEAFNLCEELGDVLMQVVMHSAIAEEEGLFTLSDVTDGISRKMIHRHPHVFEKAGEARDWEELKREEKKAQTPQEELEHIPKAFPALIRTQKVLKKVDHFYGYGQDKEKSISKAKENLERLQDECFTGDAEELLGETFLELVNYSRILGVNSEQALEKSLEKLLKTLLFTKD